MQSEEQRMKEIEEEIKSFECGEQIYHYTSINTLIGILQNRELWMGNTANMNDKKEVKYYFEEMQKNILKDIPDDRVSFCNSFFAEIFMQIENNYQFAICFSNKQNDAAQWERYADNAKGICIEFNTKLLFRLFDNCGVLKHKIYYDRNLSETLNYQRIHFYILNGYFKNDWAKCDMISQLIAIAYLHKHRSFDSEKEIRFVTVDGIENGFKEDFKLINGQIRKIKIVNIESLCQINNIEFEDLIDGIIIGPRSNQNMLELKEYLRSLNYNKLAGKVTLSDCPLR